MFEIFLERKKFQCSSFWKFCYFLIFRKPNTTKSEIAGIGLLKRVQETIGGMRCIASGNEAIKILGIYFLHKIKDEKIL